MKICISELTFNSFEDVFNESLLKDDILLLNREGKLARGEGHPEVVFVSYKIMFKMCFYFYLKYLIHNYFQNM